MRKLNLGCGFVGIDSDPRMIDVAGRALSCRARSADDQ